jgi:hypothetical protein
MRATAGEPGGVRIRVDLASVKPAPPVARTEAGAGMTLRSTGGRIDASRLVVVVCGRVLAGFPVVPGAAERVAVPPQPPSSASASTPAVTADARRAP